MKNVKINSVKDDEAFNNRLPVSLGDRKTLLFLILAACITIAILILIRFTIL